MKRATLLLLFLTGAATFLRAEDVRLKVSAVLGRDRQKAGAANYVAKGGTIESYKISIQNDSFKTSAEGLAVQYRIFVIRDDGIKDLRTAKPQRIAGQATVDVIKPGKTADVETTAVTLSRTSLSLDRYYPSGKRQSTADKMVGLWVKIFQGDKVVAEYATSSNIPKKESFD